MFTFFKKTNKNASLEWLGVDVHSHLLPGIDDGSPDPGTSVNYIHSLYELGISKFICTPHIFKEVYPNTRNTIEASLGSLKAELEKRNFSAEIYGAAEYMVNPDFAPLMQEGDMMLLPDNYILIEMSYLSESPDIEQYIFELSIKGYKPILAHPERYVFYHADFNRYQRLMDMGCLFQANLLSFAGYYGKGVKNISEKLLRQDMLALIGTDLHHQKHLDAIRQFLQSGRTGLLVKYPFQNKELFG